MIEFEHVSFTYPGAKRRALTDLSVRLPAGELALVAGPSGAGKSTFLRCINGLVPHFSGGTLSGALRVDGLDPVAATPQVMSRHVGFVFQDPEAQFVMDRVEDEIAFALENAAMPPQEMRVRVEETLDLLDLAPLRGRPLETLSGGERQRVAIAAALALRPPILVLDEPTSQLDPKSAEDVLTALARLNADLGLTVVLAEHRLERALAFADSLFYLPGDGAAPLLDDPRTVLAEMAQTPPLVRLAKALAWQPLPLTVKEGLRFSRRMALPEAAPAPAVLPPVSQPAPILETQGVTHRYGSAIALHGVDLALHPGEIVALMGRNGSGKTTLLKTLVGLARPSAGRVTVAGQDSARLDVAEICRTVGYLPQDPNSLLFADTVREELAITLRNHGYDPDAPGTLPVDPDDLLAQLGLAHLADAYPRDLSVGERQRVALAAILVVRPQALLLDEPTRGLDYAAKAQLTALLQGWRAAGMAILVVTHDVELAAALADRVALMSQGEVIAAGLPGTVLGASPFFAPQVARLFPGTGWLTPEDVPGWDIHRKERRDQRRSSR
ncbi:MAG: energy-coupling factor ABC transporter ATP-binding protein [Caldilineaceae bacterium]|nr:energy-coupling factor ABC transporter ATP-binding protein [Caldilineaceae bacterium]